MPNRIVLDEWKFAPEIWGKKPDGSRRLSKAAAAWAFPWLLLSVEDHGRLDLGGPPDQPYALRSVCPCDPDIRLPQIARYLQELQVASIVTVGEWEGRWYLELTPKFFRKYDKGKSRPKVGPPIRLEQTELAMGPVEMAVVPKKAKGRGQNSLYSSPIPRTDTMTSPSGAQLCLPPVGDSLAVAQKDGMQSDEAKRKSGLFSAGEWSKPGDDAWLDLCRFLNEGQFTAKEMWENGKNWLRKFEADRLLLIDAVLQGLTLEKEGHVFVKGRGAWLNDQIDRLSERRTA